ncbi:MAG: hypothetical protein RhofKO_16690 [Rhodothermales bacterium]
MPSDTPHMADRAHTLTALLTDEHALLTQLDAAFVAQIDAVKTRQHDALDDATVRITELVQALRGKQLARTTATADLAEQVGLDAAMGLPALIEAVRRTDAVGAKALRQARQAVKDQAKQTEAHAEQAEFMIQYAVNLGQEMISMARGEQAEGRIYNARGRTGYVQTPSSIVNQAA